MSIEKSIAEAVRLIRDEGERFHLITKMAGQKEVSESQQYTSSVSFNASIPSDRDSPEFKEMRLLGRGSEGEVHEVREISTGITYARKLIYLDGHFGNTNRTEEQVRREVDIMRKLNHQHIARVLFWIKGKASCSIYMDPCAESNFRAYLERCCDDRYPAEALGIITPWFGCLLDAVAFAHARKIIHRDIKPNNILVKNGEVFLADFGEAKQISQQGMSITNNDWVCGTAVYRAPETVAGKPQGLPTDIFSLGCVFSEMITVCARRSLTEYQEWRKVIGIEFPFMFRASLPKVSDWIGGLKCNEELLDPVNHIIKRMLREDPAMRHDASQLLNWIRNADSGVKLFCDDHSVC